MFLTSISPRIHKRTLKFLLSRAAASRAQHCRPLKCAWCSNLKIVQRGPGERFWFGIWRSNPDSYLSLGVVDVSMKWMNLVPACVEWILRGTDLSDTESGTSRWIDRALENFKRRSQWIQLTVTAAQKSDEYTCQHTIYQTVRGNFPKNHLLPTDWSSLAIK